MIKCHVNAASRHTTQRRTTPAFQSAIPNSLLCRHLGPHSLSLTFPGICGVSLSAGDGELSPRARISGCSEQAGEAQSRLVPLTSHLMGERLEGPCFLLGLCWWTLQSKGLCVEAFNISFGLDYPYFLVFFPPVTLNLASNNKIMFYAKVLKMLFSRKRSKLPERV